MNDDEDDVQVVLAQRGGAGPSGSMDAVDSPFAPDSAFMQHPAFFTAAAHQQPAPSSTTTHNAAAPHSSNRQQQQPNGTTAGAGAGQKRKEQHQSTAATVAGSPNAMASSSAAAAAAATASDQAEEDKKKRSSKACDACRKAKCKCTRPTGENGSEDGPCQNCKANNLECTFLGASKKRGPPKGYIEAIENRMHRMEALLGGLLNNDDPRAQALLEELVGDIEARELLSRDLQFAARTGRDNAPVLKSWQRSGTVPSSSSSTGIHAKEEEPDLSYAALTGKASSHNSSGAGGARSSSANAGSSHGKVPITQRGFDLSHSASSSSASPFASIHAGSSGGHNRGGSHSMDPLWLSDEDLIAGGTGGASGSRLGGNNASPLQGLAIDQSRGRSGNASNQAGPSSSSFASSALGIPGTSMPGQQSSSFGGTPTAATLAAAGSASQASILSVSPRHQRRRLSGTSSNAPPGEGMMDTYRQRGAGVFSQQHQQIRSAGGAGASGPAPSTIMHTGAAYFNLSSGASGGGGAAGGESPSAITNASSGRTPDAEGVSPSEAQAASQQEGPLSELADVVGQLSLDENREVRYHGRSSGLYLISKSARYKDFFWRFPKAGVWPPAEDSDSGERLGEEDGDEEQQQGKGRRGKEQQRRRNMEDKTGEFGSSPAGSASPSKDPDDMDTGSPAIPATASTSPHRHSGKAGNTCATGGASGGSKPRRSFSASSTWDHHSKTEEELVQKTRAYEVMPNKRTSDHLMELYWIYVHPHIPLLYRSLFVRQYRNTVHGGEPSEKSSSSSNHGGLNAEASTTGQTGSRPPAQAVGGKVPAILLLSVYALAARYSDTGGERKEGVYWKAGDVYAQKAKDLLHEDFGSSRLTTIQALLLLAYREIGCGAMARSWTFVGMAVRMAQDMGLFRDVDKWFLPVNAFNYEEKQTRKRVWWTAIVLDKYVSAYIGRPMAIFERDYDVALPAEDEPDEHDIWRPIRPDGTDWSEPPIMDTSGDPVLSAVRSYPQGIKSNSISCFNHSATLSVLFSRIIANLYAIRVRVLGQNSETLLAHLDQALANWYINLPPHLQYNSASKRVPPPHVLTLHCQFFAALILLHRPFIPAQGAEKTLTAFPSHSICTTAAAAISNIVTLYSKTYTLRQSIPFLTYYIFSAAIMHVYNSTYDESLAPTAKIHLVKCMRALQEMHITWASASRQCELLLGIVDLRDVPMDLNADLTREETAAGGGNKKRQAETQEVDSAPASGQVTPIGGRTAVNAPNTMVTDPSFRRLPTFHTKASFASATSLAQRGLTGGLGASTANAQSSSPRSPALSVASASSGPPKPRRSASTSNRHRHNSVTAASIRNLHGAGNSNQTGSVDARLPTTSSTTPSSSTVALEAAPSSAPGGTSTMALPSADFTFLTPAARSAGLSSHRSGEHSNAGNAGIMNQNSATQQDGLESIFDFASQFGNNGDVLGTSPSFPSMSIANTSPASMMPPPVSALQNHDNQHSFNILGLTSSSDGGAFGIGGMASSGSFPNNPFGFSTSQQSAFGGSGGGNDNSGLQQQQQPSSLPQTSSNSIFGNLLNTSGNDAGGDGTSASSSANDLLASMGVLSPASESTYPALSDFLMDPFWQSLQQQQNTHHLMLSSGGGLNSSASSPMNSAALGNQQQQSSSQQSHSLGGGGSGDPATNIFAAFSPLGAGQTPSNSVNPGGSAAAIGLMQDMQSSAFFGVPSSADPTADDWASYLSQAMPRDSPQ